MGFDLPVETIGWLLLAIVCGIIEIFTVGFFFAFFAAGALIAALASLFWGSVIGQSILFVVSSLAFVVFARPLLKKTLNIGEKPPQESNVNALIGTEGLVTETVSRYQGRVKAIQTGEIWSAYLLDTAGTPLSIGESGIIEKVEGAKLGMRPMGEDPVLPESDPELSQDQPE